MILQFLGKRDFGFGRKSDLVVLMEEFDLAILMAELDLAILMWKSDVMVLAGNQMVRFKLENFIFFLFW